MLKHIVMWKLKEQNKDEISSQIQEKLKALPAVIPEIIDFEVGVDINGSERAFDLVLYSTFKDEADLQTYQVHPQHQEVAKFIGSVVEAGKVVDYLV